MIGCRRAAFEGSKSNSSVWTIAWVPHAGCPCPWFCFSRVGGWDTELKSALSCTCSKLQSSPSFSMGPTHGHWQNLWRKGFMACIQVYWGKYKISIGKTKLLTILSTARTLVSLRSLAENDLVWLVTCQDPMSQLAQFCCGNLMRGEEWAAPKSP